jgi:hypothetical protein
LLGYVFKGDGLGSAGFGGSDLESSRLLLLRKGHTKLELRLGFGGTVELLVDGGVLGIENDVGGTRVGISLEDNLSIAGNVKEGPNLD